MVSVASHDPDHILEVRLTDFLAVLFFFNEKRVRVYVNHPGVNTLDVIKP